MWGICGVVHLDRQQAVECETLEATNRQIVHRGCDDAGFYVSEEVGLAADGRE